MPASRGSPREIEVKGSLRRSGWLALGGTSLGLGTLGTLLPLLPTTPFLLLAAFAFARGSPGLEAWLLAHPRFGPPILLWQRHRAINRRAKMAALLAMAAALLLSLAVGLPWWLLALQALVLGMVACFILSRPDAPRQPARVE
jgi:uncharacterized protein